jgi:Bacterial lectin
MVEFHFKSFNATTHSVFGLQLVGSAKLQMCTDHSLMQPMDNITMEEDRGPRFVRRDYISVASTAVSACTAALQLTASTPSQTGAVWHKSLQAIEAGFTTTFKVRMVNRSRRCDQLLEPFVDMNFVLYDTCGESTTEQVLGTQATCALGGGGGFAFVLHRSPDGSASIGSGNEGLGYAGLEHSLAIEFDTHCSGDEYDPLYSHLSFQSRGESVNEAGVSAMLAMPYEISIADGQLHTIQITYTVPPRDDLLATDATKLLPAFANLLGGTPGSLCVYIDQTLARCIPIDLKHALGLLGGQSYVGFTSSTHTDSWQSHQIMQWKFCESSEC